MYQRPDAPQSMGSVLDNGFQLFRASFNEVFLLAFIGAVAGQIPSQMLGLSAIAPGTFPEITGQVAFALVGAVIIGLVVYGAIVARVHAIATGANLSIGESLTIGLRKGPALLGAGCIFFLAVVLGLVALVIPGVIVSISLMFCFYAIIVKDMGPLQSISYSHKLVWGYWWRTAGLLTIMAFVLMVVYSIIGIIAGVFTAASVSTGDLATLPWYVNLLVLPLISAAVSPLIYAMSLSIYYDLELRRGGDDLAARINASSDS